MISMPFGSLLQRALIKKKRIQLGVTRKEAEKRKKGKKEERGKRRVSGEGRKGRRERIVSRWILQEAG